MTPRCELHNIRDCATCFTPEGKCDFGHCDDDATHVLDTGAERRPMCADHVDFYMRCISPAVTAQQIA